MPTIRVGEKGGSKPRKGDGSRGLSDTTKVVRHFPEEPCSDGILMASFDGAMLLYRKDVYFVAKLIRAERVLYDNQDVYLLSFEVNFMRSFAPQYRFRGADIDLTVQRVNGKPLEPKPSIRKIIPTVIAVDVSEREVNESNEVTSGAGASAGPGQLNASVKQTHSDKTTFKGRRKFHGLIKRDNHASWRLYEEKGSQSGIPSIFRIAAFVRCPEGKFEVELKLSVRMVKWPKLFGLHNLYFDSSFSAETIKVVIDPLPAPIDWLKLYRKAEAILQNEGGEDSTFSGKVLGRDIYRFKELCDDDKGLDSEEKGILANFVKDFQKSRDVVRIIDERVTILAELKEFLASKDKSDQVMKRLAKSMGISSPEKEEDSSNEPAKKADETTKDVSILEDSYWRNQRTR
jgi:hypothetical protein